MITKRHLSAAVPLLLALSACGGAAESSSGNESFQLQFATYNVPDAAAAVSTETWAAELEKETDGQVEVDFFYQESLLAGDETLQGVADGRADMGFIATAYYPAALPLSNVAGIPFVTNNAEAQGLAFSDMYDSNEDFRAEWENQGAHVLMWAPVPPNIVAMTEPVTSFDDLQGQKIRGYGYVSQALDMAGASAVGISQTEVYEGLQRGVLNGTSGGSLDIFADRAYHEVAPHYLDINYGNYAVTANAISLDVWESMPEDLQQTITDVSDKFMDDYLSEVRAIEEDSCDAVLEAGGDVTLLDDSETSTWEADAGHAIRDVWAQDVASAAPDADSESFFESYTAAIENHSEGSNYEPAIHACADRQ